MLSLVSTVRELKFISDWEFEMCFTFKSWIKFVIRNSVGNSIFTYRIKGEYSRVSYLEGCVVLLRLRSNRQFDVNSIDHCSVRFGSPVNR